MSTKKLQILTPIVTSVNGETGDVTIDMNKTAVGLDKVDNTSDADKPISTATKTALDGKQDKITAKGLLRGDGTGNIAAVDGSFLAYEPIADVEATTPIDADTLNGKTYDYINSTKQDKLTAGDNISIDNNVVSTKVYPCNPNLLDNWYFGNPVNQRGKTTYRGFGGTADRWFARSEKCYATVGSGVLKLEESGTGERVYYRQKLEWPVTEVATLTVLTGTVVGYCTVYTITATDEAAGNSVTLKANTANVITIRTKDIGAIGFGVPDGGRIDLKAVKLELGTEQTLAHQDADGSWVLNSIPDYAEMLWKCQRYLQLYTTSAARPAKALDCRPVMSSDPVQSTLTIGGTTYYANSVGM